MLFVGSAITESQTHTHTHTQFLVNFVCTCIIQSISKFLISFAPPPMNYIKARSGHLCLMTLLFLMKYQWFPNYGPQNTGVPRRRLHQCVVPLNLRKMKHFPNGLKNISRLYFVFELYVYTYRPPHSIRNEIGRHILRYVYCSQLERRH